MSDLQRWAETSDKGLYKIAKEDWSKKFTTRQLRAFQRKYNNILKLKSISEIDARGVQNMWQCATYAISIRNLGWGKTFSCLCRVRRRGR
jgi:hypothetical protein